MRVRYGKPIKVKSLLGKCNIGISKTSMSNITFYPKNDSFDVVYTSGVSKTVNRQANHKYFILINTNDFTYSWSYLGIWDTHSTGYTSDNRQAPTKVGNGDYYCVIAPITDASSGVPTLQFGTTDSTATLIANYSLIIDLTEIGLDNLTAQEFYNKYNKYFPLIATGEEITIDDKAGQVSYSSQKSLKSIVGKQIGLTADSSFQEYSITSTPTVALGDNKFGYSTVIKQASRFAEGVSIISGHQYFISVNVHNMIDRSTQRWMCIRFTAGKTGQTMLTDNKYSYQWYFTSDRVNAVLTATSSGDLGYVYFGDFPSDQKMTIATEYPESYLIVDLTDTFGVGNEPTAETFYTNYHNLFKDLENGKSLVIGKGKVAGGSSDIYYGYNQLCDLESSRYGTIQGSIDKTDDIYTITLSNSRTSIFSVMYYTPVAGISGNKYYIRYKCKTSVSGKFGISTGLGSSNVNLVADGTWQTYECIVTSSSTGNQNIYVRFTPTSSTSTGDVYTFKEFQAINLTDWYGAGKEPSTVQEFKEKFTKDYYGFCKNKIRLTEKQINALPVYGYNQLASINRDVSNGLTALFNSLTNRVNISGKSIANSTYLKLCDYFNSTIDHKYYVSVTGNNVGNGSAFLPTLHPTNLINNPKIITANTTMTNAIIRFNLPNGESINTDVIVQIIDLTDWYGAGSEPSTVEEFKQTFPYKYYQYCKKSLLNRYQINSLGRD